MKRAVKGIFVFALLVGFIIASSQAFGQAKPATAVLKISHQWPGGTLEKGDFRDRLCRIFAVLVNSVDFFQKALGAPNPLPGDNQVWQWKGVFNVLGMIGFGLFVLAISKVLLDTSYFGALKTEQVVQPQPAPTGKNMVWFWISLILSAFVSGFSYLYLPAIVNQQGFRPVQFLQAPVFFIGVWAVVNGLFALVLMLISWFFFGGKSVSLKERGVTLSLSKLWKTIVLSLVVVSSSFLIVFVADWLFKVDFRL